ncbi:DUF6544 family protein [Alkalimonas sp.]|uniref:DUF6544 family protein n=1 Tax=Alkalimonas sp. TaxID=1872453 RepID=UPI00263B1DF2|nr:DUF6544 family protein [Alkalimonas sp.]MCC5826537.1 hypothetical protein [Alkalimonas sp.]
MYVLFGIVGLSILALLGLRLWDERADRIEWALLATAQPTRCAAYDPGMVANLPEPAQRFFNFAIIPGTPLLTVAEIDMGGEFSLGNRDNPNYQPMFASQILAAPLGFVWKVKMPGVVSVSGSDTGRWTRFRILGLIPVARMGGDSNHTLAAYGRYVAEAVFWTPAALLPGPGIVWEARDNNTARVTVTHNDLSQSVDVKVDTNGRPEVVQFMRWSDANPEKIHRFQPFGGSLSDFREVQGFRVPFAVEAGNMFGTDEHFVFFKARVNNVRFLAPEACK